MDLDHYHHQTLRSGYNRPGRTPSGQLLVEIVEHEIAQEGRDHSPNAKGNFCFDRVIALDRSRCVLDLRLKR
jgi:hypothetical protein